MELGDRLRGLELLVFFQEDDRGRVERAGERLGVRQDEGFLPDGGLARLRRRLDPAEAEAFARDIEEARKSILPLKDPWG